MRGKVTRMALLVNALIVRSCRACGMPGIISYGIGAKTKGALRTAVVGRKQSV